jgi:hypothetical protein
LSLPGRLLALSCDAANDERGILERADPWRMHSVSVNSKICKRLPVDPPSIIWRIMTSRTVRGRYGTSRVCFSLDKTYDWVRRPQGRFCIMATKKADRRYEMRQKPYSSREEKHTRANDRERARLVIVRGSKRNTVNLFHQYDHRRISNERGFLLNFCQPGTTAEAARCSHNRLVSTSVYWNDNDIEFFSIGVDYSLTASVAAIVGKIMASTMTCYKFTTSQQFE